MVCLVLTELAEKGQDFADAVLNAVREILPASVASHEDLTLERLVGMRSGLRDYWILTVLWGARPQDRFSIYQDAPEALKRLGGFHFAPGTQFSYSNTNFVAVSLAIERVTGKTMNDLLQEQLFKPVGMKTAALRADMARLPSPIVGYEGSEETGYVPYLNKIEWAGDAGVSASLEDMIAYEKYVHRQSQVENSSYYKNAVDPKYIDGEPANYGYGLVHSEIEGQKTVSHSGGLAGFRLRRTYMPAQRLSHIVLLNSETDTKLVTDYTMKKLIAMPSIAQLKISDHKPENTKIEINWTGNYFDEEAKLAVVVKQDKPGEITANYDGHDDKLQILNENEATCEEMHLRFEHDSLTVNRPREHRKFTARRLAVAEVSADATTFVGTYYSEEVDSTFHVTGSGAMLYGAFDGYLGKGPVHVMRRLGEDVWWLACFRSLDAPTPGYWTVAFESGDGVDGVTVGCMGARNIKYRRVE